MTASTLPALIQRFFVNRLIAELGASPHTVASYRDTFRLLLRYAMERLGRPPSELCLEDIDPAFLSQFLDHLEADRHNSIRTRNTRLAALHAFFRFVSINEPPHTLLCQRVLAMPVKRHERGPVEFLTEEETTALLAAPDLSNWIGRRDHALLSVAVQTGLRNSEIRSLRGRDVELGAGAHVRCLGKGRKARCTPLRPDVKAVLKSWLTEHKTAPDEPVFPSSRGGTLSSDALERLVARHTAAASRTCRSLADKNVTPHTLRHSTAMELLRRGVDRSVIALWLGHESMETTQIYLHADMRLKEQALAHATSRGVKPDLYRPPDPLLAFLESL